MRPAQALRRVQRALELVVLALEGPVVVAPHLLADAHGLVEPLEALARRGEQQTETARLLLVPGRADAEPAAPAGDDVERRRALREQPGIAVHDGRHEHVQANPLRHAGQESERRVGLEHLVLGRADPADLPEVIHHRQAGDAGLFGALCDLAQRLAELRRAALPGEIRNVQP